MKSAERRQNPRGEGARLREEILDAATAVLEETGNEDAVSLRAVARHVGIAAPSIYGHFADRDEMVLAVIGRAFTQFEEALREVTEQAAPLRLPALCRAYVSFAARHPNRYRVMFARHRSEPGGAVNQPRSTDELEGAAAFGILVEAVAQHRGSAVDEAALRDATALWVALHGYVSLRDAVPAFPWPPDDSLVEDLIGRIM